MSTNTHHLGGGGQQKLISHKVPKSGKDRDIATKSFEQESLSLIRCTPSNPV